MKEIEHEYTEEIVCPWCGHAWKNSGEVEGDEYEDMGMIECESVYCGREFSAHREISVTYCTKRKKCDDGCEYELENYRNPRVHHGKNFCTWICKKCHDKKIKTDPIIGDPYVIELTEDEK